MLRIVMMGAACLVALVPLGARAGITMPPGTTVTPAQINTAVSSQINKPSGIAGLNAAGALTAPVVGSVTGGQVTASAPGGTQAVPLGQDLAVNASMTLVKTTATEWRIK